MLSIKKLIIIHFMDLKVYIKDVFIFTINVYYLNLKLIIILKYLYNWSTI